MPRIFHSKSPEDTFNLAARFAALSKPGHLIFLKGRLGAGKTHFVRGFCSGLGLGALWEVDSPTYTIVNRYDVASGIDHIDLYRFQNSCELEEIGFEEILDSRSIKLIEWPERLEDYPMQLPDYEVQFQVDTPQKRTIQISQPE